MVFFGVFGEPDYGVIHFRFESGIENVPGARLFARLREVG
jgi:hypothetical protein